MAAITPDGADLAAVGSRVTYVHGRFEEWFENGREGLEHGYTVLDRPYGEGPLCFEGLFGGGVRARRAADGEAVELVNDQGACVLRYGQLRAWDASGRRLPSWIAIAGGGGRLAIFVDDGEAAYPVTIDPLMSASAWIVEGDQDEAWSGVSVGTAGDVNGDGLSDVIVGAYLHDNGEVDEGRAALYLGSPDGLSESPAWTAEGDQTDAWFGYSVGTAGDVNGDGFSDVIVGAWHYGNGESQEGRAFVYLGSAAGLSASPSWIAESNQLGAHFGISVGTAGDVNGDGFSDVIVGAWHYGNGENHEGRAFVYHGSATGLATSPAWTAEGNQDAAYFGISVASAGDVNGDGFSDVVVGAYGYDNGQVQEGRAFAYHGSATGLGASAAWTAESDVVGSYYGVSVATAGDVNGDGYSDVIVGGYQYANGEAAEGRADVYHGSAAGLASVAAWTQEGDQIGAYFGTSVGTTGDVDGDGYSDAIVGAFLYDSGPVQDGQAFVYRGSPVGLGDTPVWIAGPSDAGGQFGVSVGTAGDVNGDQISDVIVGAWEFSDEEFEEGRALVFHGSSDVTSVEGAVPGRNVMLEAGSPNPFARDIEVTYTLPQGGRARLAVYDASGRRVRPLGDGAIPAGRHGVRWDGRDSDGVLLPPGVYFARLEFLGRIETDKIVLSR
jgi:hypothetical protein